MIKLSNNAVSYLAASISSSSTSILLQTGDGAKFPLLGPVDYFYLTLVDVYEAFEIVKVTARLGDTLTIERAQEGTLPLAFAAGSKAELRITAQTVISAAADYSAAGVIASQEEAEAGTDNTKAMTPLRTKQAIDELVFSTENTFSEPMTFADETEFSTNLKGLVFSSSGKLRDNSSPERTELAAANSTFVVLTEDGTTTLFSVGTGGIAIGASSDVVMTRGSTETVGGTKTFSATVTGTAAAAFSTKSNTSRYEFKNAAGTRIGYVEAVNGGALTINNEQAGQAVAVSATSLTFNGSPLMTRGAPGTVTGALTMSGANIVMSGANIEGNATTAITTIGANPAASITTGGYIKLWGSTSANPSRVEIGNSAQTFVLDGTNATYNNAPIQTQGTNPKAITTTSGTLVAADANCTGILTGNITLPAGVFAARNMNVLAAGASSRTVTRGAGLAMYFNGTDVSSVTLAANGVLGVFWETPSKAILSGNLS